MKVTDFTRSALASRRDARDMKAKGYRPIEADWELMRGAKWRELIVDVQIAADGKHLWIKSEEP